MRVITPVVLCLLILLSTGCGGGGGGTATIPPGHTAGGISGPTSVIEGSLAQYAVDGRNASAVTSYRWTVSPAGLGSFKDPAQANTEFIAGTVSKDTSVEIAVSISPDNGDSPTLSKVPVLIKDKAETGGQPAHTPVSSAQADPPSVKPGGFIQFRDYSHDPDSGSDIIKWEWDFSYDPNVGLTVDSSAREPNVQFPVAGSFFVQLKVTDHDGNSDLLDTPIVVTISNGALDPVAKATCYPNPASPCESIQFKNNGSYPQTGQSLVKYQWDWENDGIFDEEGTTVNHSWSQGGTHSVQFRVTDNNGRMGALSNPLIVIINNSLPVANAEFYPDNPRTGQAIEFNASGSVDTDCDGASIAKFEWDFQNDGVWDSEGSVVYKAYEEAGVYNVMLRVTDNEGGVDLLDQPLVVTVSQGNSIAWGSTGVDTGHGVAIDDEGNIYLCGSFSGIVDFDPGDGIALRSTSYDSEAFLMKLDPDRNFQWVNTWADEPYSVGFEIYVSDFGYIYIAGTTSLIKFNQFGDILWTYDNNYTGQGIAYDYYNGVYVAGHFKPAGSSFDDCFLTCLDYDGTLKWERTWGGTGSDMIYDVDIDSFGNPVVGGHFENEVDFDPGPGELLLQSVGATDSFLSKFDREGNFIWAKKWDATDTYDVKIDSSNNIYVTGKYEGWTDFDPGPDVVSYDGSMGSFLAKFDTAGILTWAKGWTEWVPPPPQVPPYEPGFGIAIDGEKVYVVGSYDGTVDFDPDGTTDIKDYGGVYISEFLSNGDYQRVHVWGAHYGDWDNAFSVVMDQKGNALVTGDFGNTCNFGIDGDEERTSAGASDAYLLQVPIDTIW